MLQREQAGSTSPENPSSNHFSSRCSSLLSLHRPAGPPNLMKEHPKGLASQQQQSVNTLAPPPPFYHQTHQPPQPPNEAYHHSRSLSSPSTTARAPPSGTPAAASSVSSLLTREDWDLIDSEASCQVLQMVAAHHLVSRDSQGAPQPLIRICWSYLSNW